MAQAFDLTQLDSISFEHMVNELGQRILGAGLTSFGPGSDGGRDGFFEGEAVYPSEAEHWSGRWYIQSKFHKPHQTKNEQKWLLEQIKSELDAFRDPETQRQLPDIWIIATNIDPSGVPETGAYDRALKLVQRNYPNLAKRFHIWGGAKIISLLNRYTDVAQAYGHFLTPGHVLSAVYAALQDERANINSILNYLIVRQIQDQRSTRLEQAGMNVDVRPGVHKLFIDLPFVADTHKAHGMTLAGLSSASARPHQPSADAGGSNMEAWRQWRQHPKRGRVWFIKGGPGQGKSTVGQYYCQIQRAALLQQSETSLASTPAVRELAAEMVMLFYLL